MSAYKGRQVRISEGKKMSKETFEGEHEETLNKEACKNTNCVIEALLLNFLYKQVYSCEEICLPPTACERGEENCTCISVQLTFHPEFPLLCGFLQ